MSIDRYKRIDKYGYRYTPLQYYTDSITMVDFGHLDTNIGKMSRCPVSTTIIYPNKRA